ncbi:MAG TPA: sialidase family protein [Bacteroidia bacterium]|nr:sialidase family protein [Bacteroidia bacterium]
MLVTDNTDILCAEILCIEEKLRSWSEPKMLAGCVTGETPSLASKRGLTCMAWQGLAHVLYTAVSVDNGKSWSAKREVPGCSCTGAPALCAVNGRFILAWKEEDNTIRTCYSIDGLNWSNELVVHHQPTAGNPTFEVVNNTAALSWQETGSNMVWVSVSKDGFKWATRQELVYAESQCKPSVSGAYNKDGLYAMIWSGLSRNNFWISASKNGRVLTPYIEIPGCNAADKPVLAYSHHLDLFYAGWLGMESPGTIFISWSPNGLWYVPKIDTGLQSQCSPVIIATESGLLMAYRAHTSNNIVISSLNL